MMGPKIAVWLLGLFAKCLAFEPPSRGTFELAPSRSTPNLVEGDMAVPVGHLGAGTAPEAFLSRKANLWPRGVVYYQFETFEWGGVVEPVFLDSLSDGEHHPSSSTDHAQRTLHQVHVSSFSSLGGCCFLKLLRKYEYFLKNLMKQKCKSFPKTFPDELAETSEGHTCCSPWWATRTTRRTAASLMSDELEESVQSKGRWSISALQTVLEWAWSYMRFCMPLVKSFAFRCQSKGKFLRCRSWTLKVRQRSLHLDTFRECWAWRSSEL